MRDSADGDLAGVLRAQGLNNFDYATQGGRTGSGPTPKQTAIQCTAAVDITRKGNATCLFVYRMRVER